MPTSSFGRTLFAYFVRMVSRNGMVTDQLIAVLIANLHPVRRLQPPLLRGAFWLLIVLVIAAPAIIFVSDLHIFARRIRQPEVLLEMVSISLAGAGAVIAAFHISLPDRSPIWAILPIAPLVLWIGSSGYSCYEHVIDGNSDLWMELQQGGQCFGLIIAFSLPLGISLLTQLRRTNPMLAVPVAAMGGLGASAVAAALLQFFHPFEVSFLDLAAHLIAIGIVIRVSMFPRRALRPYA